MILRLITPSRVAATLAGLDPAELAAAGIRGVILDLDNTLLPWGSSTPPPEVQAWVQRLRAAGVAGCIVSNNFSLRVRRVGAMLGIPVVGWALKPVPIGFWRAMAIMGTRPATTALIGDQLFTDVLGGNLLGVYTILVEPLSQDEFPTTRLVRRIERLIRARVVKRVSGPEGL
ncbi:MAG TPA: YqeG family HAD IIIA-type phosphatase [bacterium]|nr:YqeG family HAD IIIA-type phosphatase [bacterium]